MNVNVINVVTNNKQLFENLKCDNSTTLRELFNDVGLKYADVSSYYPCSGRFVFNKGILPYVIHEGELLYDVPYREALVVDFVATIGIKNSYITVKTGMPQAGGPDFPDPAVMVEIILDTLQGMAVMVSISGYNLRDLITWLRKRKHYKHQPQIDIDLVNSRDAWSSSELAELLQTDREQVKHLLRGLGYVYDRRQQQYVKTKGSDEIVDSIKRIGRFSDPTN